MTPENMEKLLHDLRVKIRSDTNITLNEQEERITSKIIENIDKKFEFINQKIEKINEINDEQEKRLTIIEKQIRERNLIFFGVDEGESSYSELEDKIIATIKKTNVNCSKNEIEIVRRIGKQNDGKIRPINLTLTTYGKKIMILKNKKMLEQTNVYLKEDFSPKILEVRKSLHEQLQKERSEGKIAYLRYDRIVIREPNQNHRNLNVPISYSNAKKRELEVTPPHLAGKSAVNPEGAIKYQTAKKNRIVSSMGSQSSIKNFVQKRNERQMLEPHSSSVVSADDAVSVE